MKLENAFAVSGISGSDAELGSPQLGGPSHFWAQEVKKTTWPSESVARESLSVVDLFSGCGGLSLGALIACQQLGRNLKVTLAADSWQDALNVYRANFARHLELVSDLDLGHLVVRPGSLKLSKRGLSLAEEVRSADIVVAGPPCQGHSDLNNSSRRDDPRNLLYTVPVAFGLHKRAKIILVENVPTVVHSSKGVVNSALQSLEENGYAVVEFVADAQDIGLPQTRRRHILIASSIHTKDELAEALKSIPRRRTVVPLWQFINDLEFEPECSDSLATRQSKISDRNRSRIDFLFDSAVFDLPNELRPPCHRDKHHSYVSMYGRLNRDLPAQTITSGFGSMGQGRYVHPTQRRMITPHEAARIQGFPDYFRFAAAKKLTSLREMIGNAVAPPVGATLLTQLLADRISMV